MRRRPLVSVLAAVCLLAAWKTPVADEPPQPDEIEGLEAWYKADSLRGTLNHGDPVSTWKDETPNGHHLTDDENGPSALFYKDQLNGLPAVQVRSRHTYSVTDPFGLAAHTVFIVYKTTVPKRAFFRSNSNPSLGVILRDDGDHDQYQDGGPYGGKVKNYNTPTTLDRAYSITVLGRDSDTLKSFVNGADVSSNVDFPGAIRVGKFFHLRHTTYVRSDGDGLRIAEMLFYNRYLTDTERDSVTWYLAQKYGIEVAIEGPAPEMVEEPVKKPKVTSLAQLSTTTDANVNDAGVVIPWDIQDELDSPFDHNTDTNNTRLLCTRDDTRVRLYVSLPLTASAPDASIRVLFRVNGANFLRGEGRSGSLSKVGGRFRGSVHAEVITTLGNGDYVEVVTLRDGASGRVTIDPESAVFTAEVK